MWPQLATARLPVVMPGGLWTKRLLVFALVTPDGSVLGVYAELFACMNALNQFQAQGFIALRCMMR